MPSEPPPTHGEAAVKPAAADPHAQASPPSPSPWVLRFAPLIPARAEVLDLACGSGRHARVLAAMGHAVLGVDRDAVALQALRDVPGVRVLQADLENAPWPLRERFGAVVVTNYLWRALLPRIVGSVDPGGVLLYETFALGQSSIGRPSNPQFLLRPGELLDAVRGELRVVAYEDGFAPGPRPAFVQRICAVRESAPGAMAADPPKYNL
ncbi:methyltransferase domain-containing protein [Thiomonas sp. FB-6]|uniref:class I SAM-dependent methyltransferase n=1 Tax=Thiomonas sp. FB-6 TaxID=1158291 RepID=UPI000382AF44